MSYFNYNNKKCYYKEFGEGTPLLFLHGNTASSRMFDGIIDIYKENNKVVLIDFIGHGKSERLERFPIDLWFDEAMQVIAFLEQMKYGKVNIIGSSGGALVAINVALERPDLVNKVIADSFEGEVPLGEFVENIKLERELSKQDDEAKAFYIYNQGNDWENVVDNDTNALYDHYKTIGKFFHKPVEMLDRNILFTGSKEDEFATCDFYEKTYSELIKKVKNGEMHLFDKGGHPAIISNAVEFVKVANIFLTKTNE
ncbi:alpha/beta fold hydrolase [Clostridium botulinum]|uniref:alpha/beta fold hydrolase n=1 Tax=Clostridium botulinum TaxID=1491 RepID=UPI003DA1D0AF